MFRKRARVLYCAYHEVQPSSFRRDKTRAASFLNGFKSIPGKSCVNRAYNNNAFVNVANMHTKKTLGITWVCMKFREYYPKVNTCSGKVVSENFSTMAKENLLCVKSVARTINMHPTVLVSVSVLNINEYS